MNTQKKRNTSLYSRIALAALLVCLVMASFPIKSHADGGFPFIGVLHAGAHPEGIAVDTRTHMVYIAYEYPGLVVGFDPHSGQVRWKTKVADSASDVQVDSTTHRVYVVSAVFQSKGGMLTVLDGATGTVLLTAPTGNGDNGLAIDTKRQRVFVASSDSQVINAFTLQTSATGQLSAFSSPLIFAPHPQAIAVNSRLGRLYIGDANDNTVSVYDEESGRVLAIIPVAALPVQPLRVDEASGRVYVVCSTGQELDVIDGNTNTVTARVPLGAFPEGVDYNTATGRIYVANEGQKDSSLNKNNMSSTITVIDGQSFAVLGTLKVGHSPNGVAADPQLRRVYVALEGDDAVLEVSDSVDLPLTPAASVYQATAIHQAIGVLQQAGIVTFILMVLVVIGATMVARSQRWRVRETPQTRPGDA